MEEIINKIFKEKYPKGLSAKYTKEEMVGYMMAINDIKEQLTLTDVVEPFFCLKKETVIGPQKCDKQCSYCKMEESLQ